MLNQAKAAKAREEAGPEPCQVTTMVIFTFPGGKRGWAFRQMGLARPLIKKAPGLRFYILMGAGRGKAFSLRPDWNRYALLAVWENEQAAREFLASSPFMAKYRANACRVAYAILKTISVKGKWDGRNPFRAGTISQKEERVMVLTRATIRFSRLPAFWQQAARVSEKFTATPGLIGSIGVGEVPFFRQATFSFWENAASLKQFAYGPGSHRQTIQRTRAEGWYREELFARFAIIEVSQPFP